MAFSFCSIYGQTEKPKYNFKMDEIAAEFESELARKKVDTVMFAYYTFDNGRGADATQLYFWTKNGKDYVKAIRNDKKKKAKEFEIKNCPQFSKILAFYFTNIEEILGSVPEPSMMISHNYGYFIKLDINDTEFKTYLREESRIGNKHCRSEWINMIAEVARPYIADK